MDRGPQMPRRTRVRAEPFAVWETLYVAKWPPKRRYANARLRLGETRSLDLVEAEKWLRCSLSESTYALRYGVHGGWDGTAGTLDWGVNASSPALLAPKTFDGPGADLTKLRLLSRVVGRRTLRTNNGESLPVRQHASQVLMGNDA
jgi:hypothetical protein